MEKKSAQDRKPLSLQKYTWSLQVKEEGMWSQTSQKQVYHSFTGFMEIQWHVETGHSSQI